MKIIKDIRVEPFQENDLLKFNETVTGSRNFDIRLSRDFLLSEFTRTKYYQFQNTIPTTKIFLNVWNGVKFILQPLRDKIGVPIIITSGYRSPLVNSCVGGAVKSQHRYGCAADIKTQDTLDYERMRDAIRTLPFDQLLTDEKRKWLHVSWTSEEYCAGGRKQSIINYYS